MIFVKCVALDWVPNIGVFAPEARRKKLVYVTLVVLLGLDLGLRLAQSLRSSLSFRAGGAPKTFGVCDAGGLGSCFAACAELAKQPKFSRRRRAEKNLCL